MTDDVIIRLKVRGENLTAETRAALAGIESEVEKQGRQAGEKLGDGMSSGFAGRATAIVAVAGGVAAAIGQAISASTTLARDLSEASRQLGVGVEDLQAWRAAATDASVATGSMDSAIGSLADSMAKALGGNATARADFAALGVQFSDNEGRARALTDVMGDVVRRLADMNDPAREAAIGTGLLGDSYRQIAPAIDSIAPKVGNLTDLMREQGRVLSQEQVVAISQADAAMQRFNQTMQVDIATAVAANAGAIETLSNSLSGLIGVLGSAVSWYDTFLRRLENQGAGGRVVRDFLDPVGGVGRAARRALLWWNGQDDAQASDLLGGMSHSGFLSSFSGTPAPVPVMPIAGRAARPARTRGGGGGGGGRRISAGSGGNDDRQRAEALAQETRYIQQQLTMQSDLARIEAVRASEGQDAADVERVRAEFIRNHAAAAATTADELARALGINGDLTAAERERLTEMIAQLDVIERQVIAREKEDQASRRLSGKLSDAVDPAEKEARALQEAADMARQEGEAVIQDLSGVYADLFSGQTGNIWRNFKHMGLSAIAEIAARFTLARLSGQPFSLQGTLSGIAGQGGLLGAAMGGLGLLGRGGGAALATQGAAGAASAGAGGASGLLSGAAPWALGALAAFPLLSGLIGGLTTKKGSASLAYDAGLLSVGTVTGNSGSRKQAASGAIGNVIEGLNRIADVLGGDISSGGSVSVGMRKKSWRVDTSGQNRTKGAGVVDFGADQEAAIRFAISEALKDGVVTGISDASKRILAAGGDLEDAIEKALSIEELPKRLKARLNPLGAALDEIDAKYTKLAATLKEGGASAEQIAQARQLWQLEREDTVKQIGEASATLKEFLKSLVVGGDSPLSLRRQTEEATKAFATYEAQVAALQAGKAQIDALRSSGADAATIAAAEQAQAARAGAFDQSGFTSAADLLLGLSRRGDASTGNFFSVWNRIRGLTETTAGLIDATVPGSNASDPFAQLTAQATQNTAAILDTHTSILNAINDNLAALNGSGGSAAGGSGFLYENRNFV